MEVLFLSNSFKNVTNCTVIAIPFRIKFYQYRWQHESLHN
jgi:hypothetical protein